MVWDVFRREFDPWRELRRMEREMRRMQEDIARLFPGFTPAFVPGVAVVEFPPVNMWREENNALIVAELPGISLDDIDVSVSGRILTLSGSRKPEEENEEVYQRRERWYGDFTKRIELPFLVEADKVEAKFKNGVLYITLPRAEAEKPKKISIKAS
ncbi:MAG: Hsp20/alpha crystallin family protein [Nitrospirae bacterium]|nr:MAG: Hsp20/alpha crystallin family protein [Nitrospirota bacterium]